ncbi:hypothetical protein C1H46_017511 [Malus baccata]|uniref:ADP-ribosyl cyclase/cyclic ADP-ribose hydrolase n=1 Tax=Malus baccata TaxID=106549 RepID=A0A540MDS9_MALBA|nr:hypothetical protein C1H46_017511 [Malus baccata]
METRIEQIEPSLCIDSLDVYTVGIWGMGGIGKTTLADAVFHRLSSKFEASCFLGNVREKSAKEDGLVRLRNTLLSEILKENDLNIGTPTIGLDHVRKRMRGTKVLIVLDDVNDSNQLNFLAGDPDLFGPGSRIIVTTRDKSLLQKSVEQNKIYEVQELNSDEAFQLLHSSAFGNNISRVDCAELSKIVVDYCGGIPLALQSLGSSFLHCESKEDWLDEWKEFPREKIWEVLRSSYDGLKEIEKEIFLDIACFYQGKDVYIVKELLDILGFRASVINVLIDKSLISISTSNSLQMHNLLQEMGRAIVHKQCNEEPEKCSRLFVDEDFNQELKTNTGSPTLQAIFFNRSAIQGILWNHADSEKMYDLRLLYVYNSSRNKYCKVKVSLPDSLTYLDWEGYPFNSLPSKLSPENLVEIQMRNSQVEQLEGQNLINLRVMDLGLSKHLMEVPDLSQSPNIEHINLSGTAIKSVPASIGNLKSLEELDLSGTAITCLPASIKEASRLICLRLTNCRSLESLPELPGVRWLQAHGCTSLKKVLSSKTALTLGWDEYKNSQGLQEQLTFSNCIGMGWDAWCDILTDSQIRIVRMAIALSKHFKQEDIEVASHLEFEDGSKEYVFRSPFCVVCSGNIIPRWFPYEVHKSVLQIKLGPNFFSTDFLGFAYSVVVAFKNYNVRGSLRLGCKINFKGRGDHCIYHRSCMVAEYGEINECKFDEHHSFVWFSTLDHVKQGSYNDVTEAIFDFYPIVDDLPHGGAIDCSKIEVTMCGVYPMYARYMWFSYSMNRQF